MWLLRSLPVLLALSPLSLAAQATAHTAGPGRPIAAALRPYVNCSLPGGPEVVERTALPQAPMTRAAQTFTGPKAIRLVDGVFVAFSYPNTSPFANVKVEQLPAATYSTEKADLISEFDKINATGNDTQRNYALKPTLNGFEIYGFDRVALTGNVLGIYLFFDNARHVASTAYFLNAPDGQRSFNTLEQYSGMREQFMNSYTGCVRKALSTATPAKPPAPASAARHAH